MSLSLDAGCSDKAMGDVNLDLFIDETVHRYFRGIEAKKIKNFVRGDVNNLPFRDEVFTKTYCEHVLEHEGVYATKTINELKRVTSGTIEIRIPHYLLLLLQQFFPIHGHNKVLTPGYFRKMFKDKLKSMRSFEWTMISTRWGRLPLYLPNQFEVIAVN